MTWECQENISLDKRVYSLGLDHSDSSSHVCCCQNFSGNNFSRASFSSVTVMKNNSGNECQIFQTVFNLSFRKVIKTRGITLYVFAIFAINSHKTRNRLRDNVSGNFSQIFQRKRKKISDKILTKRFIIYLTILCFKEGSSKSLTLRRAPSRVKIF